MNSARGSKGRRWALAATWWLAPSLAFAQLAPGSADAEANSAPERRANVEVRAGSDAPEGAPSGVWPSVRPASAPSPRALQAGEPASPAPSASARGAVLVWAGPADDLQAWPLARELYAVAGMVPPQLQEPWARALAGAELEAPSASTRELAELRASLHDEGAASRSVLRDIGQRAGAELVVWVLPGASAEVVRVRWYWPQRALLDSTLFEGELSQAAFRAQLVAAAARAVGQASPRQPAPSASPERPGRTSLPFLKSPWFWGAIGAAVAGGVVLWAVGQSKDKDVPVSIDASGVARSGLGTQAVWAW